MAIFFYRAKTTDGKLQRGKVEARTQEQATKVLQDKNLVILELFLESDVPFYARSLTISRLKVKDLVIFSRQISVMVSSGVSLLDAVNIMSSQTDNAYFRGALQDVASSIDSGMQLSESLSKHPDIFSPFYIEMVRAGELSGGLEAVLLYLADYTEETYRTKRKVQGAMTYPAFVIAVFLIIGIAVFVFIIPRLAGLITENGEELPFITEIMLTISDILKGYWYALLGLVVVASGLFISFFRTPKGKLFFDELLLKIPIISRIAVYINVNQFLNSMHILIRGGIPIAESLRISSNVVGNSVFKNVIEDVRQRVIEGSRIAPVLATHEVVPRLLTRMFSAGEETGKLESILSNLADFYGQELSEILENVSSIIQPILIVFLGAGVFIFMVSVLLPIYNAMQV